jgi:hypothetical protein
VGPYVTLEALLRRLIRDAVHEEVRVQGVPDASLSEANDPSCVRSGPMTTAEAARYYGFKSTAAIRGRSEKSDSELAPHTAERTRLP